ncbi:MAG: sensor histidine kinase [Candidatus Cyclobacteriaceae bacterium M3_2C_046]
MVVNSRGVAFVLAVIISVVTTAFLSLNEDVPTNALFVSFGLAFGSSYLLINVALEFFIFREINKIYEMLEKLKNEDLSFIMEGHKKSRNPFKRINEEIFSYAAVKQREIEELKKLEAFRREFLADVSHELKTPIFAAQGFVLTLLDGAIKDKSVRTKFLKKAAKSLEGLETLLEDLLTISQMETGEIKMNFENFNIYELTQEVFDQFESKAEKKNINLSFAGEINEYLMVHGDSQRIYQVIVNLISNALKYTTEEGKIEVYYETSKNDITIFVRDNGIGIPPQDLKRIFERFYRVDKSRSKEKGGTGLGLAIVKHILEAHNTKISVTSTLGKGSIFSFKLKKAENPVTVTESI